MRLRISAIHNEAPGIKIYSLKPENAGLSFICGQFITILHPDHNRVVRRSYSLFTYKGQPAIAVKRIDNGTMSRWLHDDVEAGAVLNCEEGAHGVFHLPSDFDGRAIWLFAAGIGITPVYAILQDALRNSAATVVLIYSSHTKADCILRKELEDAEQRYPGRLRIAWLFSDAKNLLRARFSKESFPVLRRDVLTHEPAMVTAFVCGPRRYMWLVRLLLESAGVPDASIRQERFVPENVPVAHQPSDKDPHRVTLLHKGETFEFTAAFPDSILRAARKAGLRLPYSCDAGQCGACLAYCRSGHVWMSYNEVLTARDLEAGRVLTCTGYAVGGDVTIEIPG